MRTGRMVAGGLTLLIGLTASGGCRQTNPSPPELTVFVAASLTDVVAELCADFTAETGIEVAVSAAATGILSKQIIAGAGCDVFIAADPVEVDKLVARGRVLAATGRDVARNRLVAIACTEKTRKLAELADLRDPAWGRIAIGDPAYVPAGRYARSALRSAGVWDAVADRLVHADNVRVAGQYVRGGQAGVALVYATDAAAMPDCAVLVEIDDALTGPIRIPAVVVAQSEQRDAAGCLLDFLSACEQTATWRRFGFEAP
jgi:molybdate transport system substrate-binding protein